METTVKGVKLSAPPASANPMAKRNMDLIVEFFSLYLKDRDAFYALWADDPEVVTPFVAGDLSLGDVAVYKGADGIRQFWDPIFDMKGRFDWRIDTFIPGEDPDVIITQTRSVLDVITGETWGGKRIAYEGRYIQIFRFAGGKIRSFTEYYDTAMLNAQYGG